MRVARSPRPPITLDELAALHDALDAVRSRAGAAVEVQRLLAATLRGRDRADVAWSLWLLEGARLPRRWAMAGLRHRACEAAAVGDGLFEQCLQASGDEAEVVAHLLANRSPSTDQRVGQAQGLGAMLRGGPGPSDADPAADTLEGLAGLTPAACWLVVKAMTGGLPRVATSADLQRALGAVEDRAPALLALRWPAWRAAMRAAATGPAAARTPSRRRVSARPAAEPALAADPTATALLRLLGEATEEELGLLPGPVSSPLDWPGMPGAAVPEATAVVDGVDPTDAAGVPSPPTWHAWWTFGGVDAELVRCGRRAVLWTAEGLLEGPAVRPLMVAVGLLAQDLRAKGEWLDRAAARRAGLGDGRAPVLLLRQPGVGAELALPSCAVLRSIAPITLHAHDDLNALWHSLWHRLWARERPPGASGLRLRRCAASGAGASELMWRPPARRLRAVALYLQRRPTGGGECTLAVWSRAPAGPGEVAAVGEAIARREPPSASALHLVPMVRLSFAAQDPAWPAIEAAGRAACLGRFGPVQLLRPSLVADLTYHELRANARRRSGLELVGAQLMGPLLETDPGLADCLQALRSDDGGK